MIANSIQFTNFPNHVVARISAANTNRDGTGTIVDLVSGIASPGRYIRKIRVKAITSTTAGSISIYVFDGTTSQIEREIPVTITTASATTQTFEGEILFSDLDALILVGTSVKLQASTQKAETFNVHVDYCD